MHLLGCQDQKKQTVDQFYTEVIQWEKPVSRELGRVRLSLIARLAPKKKKKSRRSTEPPPGKSAASSGVPYRRWSVSWLLSRELNHTKMAASVSIKYD